MTNLQKYNIFNALLSIMAYIVYTGATMANGDNNGTCRSAHNHPCWYASISNTTKFLEAADITPLATKLVQKAHVYTVADNMEIAQKIQSRKPNRAKDNAKISVINAESLASLMFKNTLGLHSQTNYIPSIGMDICKNRMIKSHAYLSMIAGASIHS